MLLVLVEQPHDRAALALHHRATQIYQHRTSQRDRLLAARYQRDGHGGSKQRNQGFGHAVRTRSRKATMRAASRLTIVPLNRRFLVERVTRIELALSAWEADVLPLNYTRAAWAVVRITGIRPSCLALPAYRTGTR
jgi:hypothetical protein